MDKYDDGRLSLPTSRERHPQMLQDRSDTQRGQTNKDSFQTAESHSLATDDTQDGFNPMERQRVRVELREMPPRRSLPTDLFAHISLDRFLAIETLLLFGAVLFLFLLEMWGWNLGGSWVNNTYKCVSRWDRKSARAAP
jgi:hypothetical protein